MYTTPSTSQNPGSSGTTLLNRGESEEVKPSPKYFKSENNTTPPRFCNFPHHQNLVPTTVWGCGLAAIGAGFVVGACVATLGRGIYALSARLHEGSQPEDCSILIGISAGSVAVIYYFLLLLHERYAAIYQNNRANPQFV